MNTPKKLTNLHLKPLNFKKAFLITISKDYHLINSDKHLRNFDSKWQYHKSLPHSGSEIPAASSGCLKDIPESPTLDDLEKKNLYTQKLLRDEKQIHVLDGWLIDISCLSPGYF